jgi:GTPase SAR1 family protein
MSKNIFLFYFSKQSFTDIEMWLKELKTHANPDIKVFLIGNKIDLAENRKVTEEEAKKFKEEYSLNLYMETSAKTGINAREIFIEAARILYKEYNKYKKVDEEKKIKLPDLKDQDPNNIIEKKKCQC